MGLSLLVLAACLALGLVAAISTARPSLLPDIGASLRNIDPVRKFSPSNTLFIIGPAPNHQACRMQRRLLKPAIPSFIREDITVMEVYGDDRPRKNGEPMSWLDPSLLRHALGAEDGFFVVYVGDKGRTLFRSQAPMVTKDILRRARLQFSAPDGDPKVAQKAAMMRRLRTA